MAKLTEPQIKRLSHLAAAGSEYHIAGRAEVRALARAGLVHTNQFGCTSITDAGLKVFREHLAKPVLVEPSSLHGGPIKLTKRAKEALLWVAENEPVSWFPVGDLRAPSRIMQRRLLDSGFLTQADMGKSRAGIARFLLTPLGRATIGLEYPDQPTTCADQPAKMEDQSDEQRSSSHSNVVFLDEIASGQLKKLAIEYVGGRAITNANDYLAELQRELSLRGKPTDHMFSWVDIGIRLSDFIGPKYNTSTLLKTGWQCAGRPIYRFSGNGRNEWFVEPSSGEPIVVCVAACSRFDAPLTKHQIGVAILGIPPGPMSPVLQLALKLVSDWVETLSKNWHYITRSQLEEMFDSEARDIPEIELRSIGPRTSEVMGAVSSALRSFGTSDFEVEANINGFSWRENINR